MTKLAESLPKDKRRVFVFCFFVFVLVENMHHRHHWFGIGSSGCCFCVNKNLTSTAKLLMALKLKFHLDSFSLLCMSSRHQQEIKHQKMGDFEVSNLIDHEQRQFCWRNSIPLIGRIWNSVWTFLCRKLQSKNPLDGRIAQVRD